MAKRFTKPPHISERAWALAGGMTLRQLAGQLTSIDPGRYPQLTGEDIALAVARGEIGCVGLVGDRLRELQEIAVANGHPPLLVKDDGRRGFYLVAPFPLYCFDMGLVRRAHEQAAVDAQHAGVTLIRLTCDYSFAQNQGRTQEGGLISDPVFMSDVTRASTEGLTASGRIAVILKHMGPYQYTAGPDYTALPIERTEFLETVLPRYAGGFEAGAHGVMMGFVALNGVPAHADPFLRDLVKANAGPGAVIELDYDGIYELYGGFGYAGSPKDAALRAFREGGIHFDLASLLYLHHLPELVEEGRLGEGELLVRAAEVLDVKERVGLLDDPFMGTAADRTQVLLAGPATPYRDLAKASVVLLRPTRPDPAVLPIPTEGVRLCVLGPLAHQDPEDWIGAYSSHANRHLEQVTTPLAGIRRHWPAAAYARGCDYDCDDGGGDRRAVSGQRREAADAARLAREATHVVLFLGERHKWSGELATLAEPRLPLVQRRLVQKVRRANPGAKLIVFVTAGRALHVPREVEENADAIFWTAHLGTFAGDAIADILAGVASPTARLSHGLPIADGITSGFDFAASADRPAAGAGGAGVAGAAPAPSLVRLLPRARRPLAGGLLLRRRLRLYLVRAFRLVAERPPALRFGRRLNQRQRAGDQHRQPGRHRDRAPLLPGHGVRGASPTPSGATRPPAGDARPGGVRDAGLHGHPRDACQVRPQPRCWPAGLARPESGREPRPAVPGPA